MDGPDELHRRTRELEERLSRLSEASLRINESLDFNTVLQEVADSARVLTASRYAATAVLDEAGDSRALSPRRCSATASTLAGDSHLISAALKNA